MNVTQQLDFIQTLTLALQSATDPEELQEQLLTGLVDHMGFRKAAVAMYDPSSGALTGWLCRGGASATLVSHATALSLDTDDGPVARAMRTEQIVLVSNGEAPTSAHELNVSLGLGDCYRVFPMYLRGQPVGVLMVDCSGDQSRAQANVAGLPLLASYAGVALGSLRLCVDRAQRQAIEEERFRIAADIHDTVSQSLFGLAYGLNACTQMLPDEPAAVVQVKKQLENLQPLAFAALYQIRSVILEILPGELNRERFVNGLHKHLSTLCLGRTIALTVTVTPEFNSWSSDLRRQLFLIAQEGIVNVGRHAQAQHATVTLTAEDSTISLAIEDDGVGFDVDAATSLPGVGVDGMRRRALALGGELTISSAPGAGTRVQATIPLHSYGNSRNDS
jgi:signal transduction histidine kinase